MLLLLIVATPSLAQSKKTPQEVAAKVVKIIDGDTVDVTEADSTYRIRLYGIDAPEKGQEFFSQSRDLLRQLTQDERVVLQLHGRDRYGRTLATIIRLSDRLNINYHMVKSGMAWHFVQYSDDPELAKLEKQAKKLELGIWSLFNYVEPWEFRKNMRN